MDQGMKTRDAADQNGVAYQIALRVLKARCAA